MDAVRLIRRELEGRVPLIGFSGSPWTLATYMVEGGSSKDFALVKGLIYERPELAHELLGKVTTAVIAYLKAQVAAGVQALMLFDTWGGALSTAAYREFSLRYMDEITGALKSDPDTASVPLTLFTKGGGNWLEEIAATGCDCVGLDWTLSLGVARERIGGQVALQGNMDPSVLYASSEKVAAEARRIVQDFGPHPGHVFNLGHGIHPDIAPEHAGAMIEAVHELSVPYHTP